MQGFAVVLLALSVLLSACQGTAGSVEGSGPDAEKTSPIHQPSPGTTPAALDVFPADRATNIAPNSPVTVKASSGTLGDVTLAGPQGERVKGVAGADGVWKSSELLRPTSAYILTVSAKGPDGAATITKTTFKTLTPKVRASYSLVPSGGIVAGVGMPVIVRFDSPVTTKAQRAEVEKRVKVTSVPAQPGAWGWLDQTPYKANTQLLWRPAAYWKTGTKVTVSTRLHGVQTGVDKWITGDDATSFTIGSAMISTVDIRTHQMTVRENGVVIRTMPVSTGRATEERETRSGTKVIIERQSALTMTSATLAHPILKGALGYYSTPTKWTLRVTWTGEFLHSAPWAGKALGSTNISHGCTNMYEADAKWMFNASKMGDVVTFTGSSRQFEPKAGLGVWAFKSFADWKNQSALV